MPIIQTGERSLFPHCTPESHHLSTTSPSWLSHPHHPQDLLERNAVVQTWRYPTGPCPVRFPSLNFPEPFSSTSPSIQPISDSIPTSPPPPHLSPHHDHTSAYIRIRIESCDLTLPFLCTSPNRLHSYLSMAAYGNYEVTCPQTFLRGFTVLQKFKNGFVAQVPEMVSRLIFPFLK